MGKTKTWRFQLFVVYYYAKYNWGFGIMEIYAGIKSLHPSRCLLGYEVNAGYSRLDIFYRYFEKNQPFRYRDQKNYPVSEGFAELRTSSGEDYKVKL